MPTPTPTALDHNAALHASRSCFACGTTYGADDVEADRGWEPTRNGWRCGACSRVRRREVRKRADELIASTEPSWTLVLDSPAYGALKADSGAASSDRVFPTQRGNPLNDGNVRKRILAKAVERANEHLEKAGSVPLPEGLTPHKLRHTFASLLVALGTDPGAVMDELGHTDPGFTLRVDRHGMRRDQQSKVQLSALVGLEVQARAEVSGTNSGTNGQIGGAVQPSDASDEGLRNR